MSYFKCARPLFGVVLLPIALGIAPLPLGAQEVPFGIGEWDPDSLGNHRAVVRVDVNSDAVRVRIPWRRRDRDPEGKNLIILDALTGYRIDNLVRVDVNRVFGDLIFQPIRGPGEYHIYYLPHTSTGRRNYPTVEYPPPVASADARWLRRNGLESLEGVQGRMSDFPEAEVVEIQAVDELNSFFPMEVIATPEEVEALKARDPSAPFFLFLEDRAHPIKMTDGIPLRWVEGRDPAILIQNVLRGEFFVFQIGVFAHRQRLEDLSVHFTDLRPSAFRPRIPAAAFRVFNVEGVDSKGRDFTTRVDVEEGKVLPLWIGVQIPEDAEPGHHVSEVSVIAQGGRQRTVAVELRVSDTVIEAAGDDEPWRLSRLRWLDSRIALDDEIVSPFTPVRVSGNTVSVLGRSVTLDAVGFPSGIESFFAPEMTHLAEAPRQLLSGPVRLALTNDDGEWGVQSPGGIEFVKETAGVAVWQSHGTLGPLVAEVRGDMEFDGNIEFQVVLRADEAADIDDIHLEIPIALDVARYMMGMGYKGGRRPASYEWSWAVEHNQDGAWIGDVNAGLQFSMKDTSYVRPLNTNFYLSKPLIMPASWENEGKGGCRFEEVGDAYRVRCYSGARRMEAGEVLHFDFRLALTPFKPIDTEAQWSTRFFHRFASLDSIASTGANTVNVHHATPINPYINYPFLRPEEMTAYVDSAHDRGMKVKIYYTVRELTNRAPEIFALFSLGTEILSSGPGGGAPWLQEHLNGDYIAGWYVPDLKDAAVINSGVSRWHNFYLEGLDWLVRNVGIDGLYIDDVAFDRVTMQRVRKILDHHRPGALIDLHSANQFNVRDGFANSGNLYLEHFPYIDRLWFGEYFDYDSDPDFWMVELSGIPFGLMGEMLQGGGNQWRGMLFGMTSRLPWAGDPTPLWEFWDEYGIADSRMVGYWVPEAPVRTHREDVLATTFVGDGRTLVAVASWAPEVVSVSLEIDWDALGLDSASARISIPEIGDFQAEQTIRVGDPLRVEPGRGHLLVIEGSS